MEDQVSGSTKEQADFASRILAIEEQEQKSLFVEKKLKSQLLAASISVLIATMLGTFVSLFASFTSDIGRNRLRTAYPDPVLARSKLNELESRLKALEESVNKAKVSSQSGQPFPSVKSAADVESLNNRMNALSMAIMANPERAIAIPLLRRDIDGVSKRMEELRFQGKSDMDRLYEQQKWMLGGIGTVLLAVAGGAISIIYRTLPKGDKDSG
jgi:hypothetical protein